MKHYSTLSLLSTIATIALIMVSSCQSDKKEDIITIDMNQYETVDFNSLVESISSVKLQQEGSLSFDFSSKIIQNKNQYFLFTGNEVFIYEDSGKFINRITFGGKYMFISTIHISPDGEQLWVICSHNVMCKYELDGTFIEEVLLPFSCVDLIEVNKQDFLIYDGGFNKDWEHNFALTNMIEVEKFFLIKNKNMLLNSSQGLFAANVNGEEIFILPKMKDTIYFYKSKEKKIEPYYHLDFHGDYLTEKMIPKDGYFSDKEMSDIITQKTYIYSTKSFYQASDKLFFRLLGKRNNSHIINLKDNSLKSYDSLFDGYSTSSSFLGTNGEDLFMVVKEKSLAEHYKNRQSSYPSFQNDISTMSDKEDGWILLSIKIKD